MPRFFVPGTTVSLLSAPSKMPSRSFSLPAVRSCPSAVFGKGAICDSCYAHDRGMYLLPCVKHAQEVRFQWAIKSSMGTPADRDTFVELMVAAIDAEALRQERKYYREVSRGEREMGEFTPVFRVHDSGDLFSPAYAELWRRVTAALPDVRFWIPTRQWRSKNVHMVTSLRVLAQHEHVVVRPSALYFDDPAPVIEGLDAGSTASTEGFTCPASLQGNQCRDCRACWSKTTVVSYHKH